jgi:hypothetical protein
MKRRTGTECKKIDCENYDAYRNWPMHKKGDLSVCRECRNCFLSQYKKKNNVDLKQ